MLLSHKQAVDTVLWVNQLRWDNLMNKSIICGALPWNDDFLMHVHVSSSKSVIWVGSKCTFTCVIICNMFKIYLQASILRCLTLFITIPCEMYSQSILKLITLCGKYCVVLLITPHELRSIVYLFMVTNQSAWWKKVACFLRQTYWYHCWSRLSVLDSCNLIAINLKPFTD